MTVKVKAEAEAQPVQRQYQRLDSIANARRAGDVDRRRREILAGENAMNAQPLNTNGYPDRGYMISQIAQDLAVKREALKTIIAMEGDEVVFEYCQDIIQDQPVTGVMINGEPLARGAVPPSFAPGMQNG